MASLKIIVTNCREVGCTARATRQLLDKDGQEVGVYCSRHANTAHIALEKAEGGRGRA